MSDIPPGPDDPPPLGYTAQLAQATVAALTAVQEGQERIAARVEEIAGAIDLTRADFLVELGKTRADLMERMQNVRDDVTVNLAAAQLAEQAARSATDQGRVLTDVLSTLTRQVRQLQDAVAGLRNGRPAT
jgi:hypothetical protein